MRALAILIALSVATTACGRSKSRPNPERPLAPVENVSLPDLEKVPVSSAGQKAIGDLARASGFGGSAVGVAGTPTAPIAALRLLWTDPHATDAFLYVLAHGTMSGKLLALCGLYYSDPSAFSREVGRFRSISEKVPVLYNGCIPGGDPTAVSAIVEKPNAVRLSGPSDTLATWSAKNPGKPLELDIVGGGYPASFRPYVPPAAPSAANSAD